MQTINVSLAKAYKNTMLLKFPDKQQNSDSSWTFQSKQNSVTFPDFREIGNPAKIRLLTEVSIN